MVVKQFKPALFATVVLLAFNVRPGQSAEVAPSEVDFISGAVTGAAGPEAGVWVIAETNDLATPFMKVVVTNEEGKYVLPQLPKAHYKIWVRGYGLSDSEPLDGAPSSRGQGLRMQIMSANTDYP